jgi:hypothetical protein
MNSTRSCFSRVAHLAEHFACGDVERGDQRLRSVSLVLKLKAAGGTWLRKRLRMNALKRLDAGLLVDAHDGGTRGRLKVELRDPIDLRREIRVGAVKPHLHPMRPELFGAQDAPDLAQAQGAADCWRPA